MELTLDKVILFGGYFGISLLILITILRGVGRNSDSTNISRIKGRKEQRMLQVAISACAEMLDFDEMLLAIGKHAAETSGFKDWLLFIEEDGSFRVAQGHFENDSNNLDDLRDSVDPRLYDWVRVNSESLSIGRHVPELAGSDEMRQALSKMIGGQIVPFRDLQRIHGFVILGNRSAKERGSTRSNQFYDLFSSFAAILIKNARLNQEHAIMRQNHYRVETLASLGKLAAGLADEIRNPLAFIKISTQHLENNYQFSEDDADICSDIVDEIDRINTHVEDLLVLGKVEVDEFAPVEIGQLLEDILRFVEKTADMNAVTVRRNLAEEELWVSGDEKLLRQLFMNIIINGMEAMPRGGSITVDSAMGEAGITVDITDSGPGIKEELQKNLFNPFFTTKEMGTGLGLSIGFNVAQTHKGKLELLKSSPRGTSFRVSLPALKAKPEDSKVAR